MGKGRGGEILHRRLRALTAMRAGLRDTVEGALHSARRLEEVAHDLAKALDAARRVEQLAHDLSEQLERADQAISKHVP